MRKNKQKINKEIMGIQCMATKVNAHICKSLTDLENFHDEEKIVAMVTHCGAHFTIYTNSE